VGTPLDRYTLLSAGVIVMFIILQQMYDGMTHRDGGTEE
jgi:hypothetical protein